MSARLECTSSCSQTVLQGTCDAVINAQGYMSCFKNLRETKQYLKSVRHYMNWWLSVSVLECTFLLMTIFVKLGFCVAVIKNQVLFENQCETEL